MNWTILQKYLKGTCTEDELNKLGKWLDASPANEDFFSSFIESYKPEEFQKIKTDAREAWEEFKKREEVSFPHHDNEEGSFKLRKISQRKSRGYKNGYYFAAAVIVLVASLLFVAERYTGQVSDADEEQLDTQEIVTTKGQRTNLKLSDGSKVLLNSESKLLIPKDFDESSRMVYLKGEAFFDVGPDDRHPFMVITPQGYVEDLGTQFNVTAYDTNRIEVALKEGLASLGRMEKGEPQRDLAKLTPNKLGVLSKDEGVTVTDIEDINVFTGWTEGKLVFNEDPFADVAQELERWYDLEIKIADPQLTDRTLSATYDNMSLKEVLEVLSASLRMVYEQDGKAITFKDEPVANRDNI